MRIVLDLQEAQTENRFRESGRYSVGLAGAIARQANQHEVWLVLSGRFPHSIEPLRAQFTDLIPPERIRIVELPGPVAELDPANAWRMQAAELIREKFLADLRPDIVHNSTMLEGWSNEVVASTRRLNLVIPTSATIYDLAPLLRTSSPLCNPAQKRFILRRVQFLKETDLLLAISESSRRKTIEALDIPPERVVTVGAGIDEPGHTRRPVRDAQAKLTARYDLRRPFVLYAGGIEPSRTLERLIAAFALMPKQIRLGHQLVVINQVRGGDQNWLADAARKHGLDTGEIVSRDDVSADDLRLFYAACAASVIPVFDDGLANSASDAMAEGAPVIGPNCTGVLEIIDRKDVLFDPQEPQELADVMARILSTPEFRRSLKAWAFERAKVLSWAASARKALSAFEALHAKRTADERASTPDGVKKKPLLAFISVLPSAESDIARFCAGILAHLAQHYDVICIVDEQIGSDPRVASAFTIRDVKWFESNAEKFERILYHIGNVPACKHMFALLEREPGVVVLQDFHLGSALNWMEESEYARGSFTKALYDSHGFVALQEDQLRGRENAIRAFPCNSAILRTSFGIIGHSAHLPDLVRIWYGENGLPAIRELPVLHDESQLAGLDPGNDFEKIVELYQDFIEETYATSPRAREQNLIRAIASAPAAVEPSDADLESVAAAIAANRERFGWPQILVDVTILAGHDARTGIQRVTRAILMALICDPPPGYRIEPVRADGDLYLYARRFTSRCLGLEENVLADDPVEAGRGDVFLGVEWAAGLIPAMKPWFLKRRRSGVQIVFIVHDLLALVRPEFFPPTMPPAALEWLTTVAEIADKVACVSRTVADQLHAWLASARPQRLRPLYLGFFHHGADLNASLPSKGIPEDGRQVLEKMRSRPSFLMVGTVEPRKGHRQVLDAMERLWADRVDVNLVIVGQKGWMMDDFVERIDQHAERDDRLFWLQGISDEMLEEVYRSTRALLAASEGEGFGLPLIEAAQHGLPIIARDIPVFREVAAEHAFYFHGEKAQALADALRSWLSLGDNIPASTGMPWLTWKQSSRQLLDVVLGRRWYRSWPDDELTRSGKRSVPLCPP
jgi:glycosyltransferase involved in cell wall biosynthesis